MASDLIGIGVGASVGVVFAGIGIAWVVRVVRQQLRRTPANVVKHLDGPGAVWHVRVSSWPPGGGTWNPAKPLGFNNPIFGAGSGTYQVVDDGEVRLDWRPASGPQHTYRGPRPDQLKASSPARQRKRRLVRAFVAVYVGLITAGFVAGVSLSNGHLARRAGFGGLGIAAALVGLWLTVLTINVTHGTRAALRPQRNTEPSRETAG